MSVKFGGQVSLRVHHCKRETSHDFIYFKTLLWQTSGRQNGLMSPMLFSESHKIMANKVAFLDFRGRLPQKAIAIGAIAPPGYAPDSISDQMYPNIHFSLLHLITSPPAISSAEIIISQQMCSTEVSKIWIKGFMNLLKQDEKLGRFTSSLYICHTTAMPALIQ